jgi:hypothetical protein
VLLTFEPGNALATGVVLVAVATQLRRSILFVRTLLVRPVMTVEDDRDNSPLEEQIFGVILLVPLFTDFFSIVHQSCSVYSWAEAFTHYGQSLTTCCLTILQNRCQYCVPTYLLER